MQKVFKLLGIGITILALGGCTDSNKNDDEHSQETTMSKNITITQDKVSDPFTAKEDIEITNKEREMNASERMNELFNATDKDKIIDSTTEEFQYQFAVESSSHGPFTQKKQIEENKQIVFNNLDKEIGLKKYFTGVALKNIKDSFEQMNSRTELQYPLEFFFLAQYKASYWSEVKTNDEGYVNAYIDRKTVVFDGQSWNVAYVDSEGENVAKMEITNNSIENGPTGYKNSYSFDSELLKNKVENKDNDQLAQSLQLSDHKYENLSVSFENPGINPLGLTSIGGRPALVVTLNKEDSIWKINSVEYGY